MTNTLASSLHDRSQLKATAISRGKVSSHWKLLKTLINSDEYNKEQNVKKGDDAFPQIISHGVHHAGKINSANYNLGKRLKFVAFNPLSNSYATISDEGKITVFFSNGRSKRIKSDDCFRGIVYATKTKQCVCWGIGDKLKCWSFRYGGKYLMPRKVITEYLENCTVSGVCLEDCLTKNQRCFISTGSSIASFNILEGKCLSFLKNRHAREITSLVFFSPLKYLVTAAKDGSIKVWNDDGGLEIAFVGHHACVNQLAIYPFGHFIMSASSDMTLRVWSLEAKDEVDKMQCDHPVDGIGTVAGSDNLYSFTSEGIDLWKIKHIHTVCTAIGCKIKSVKQTTHPKVPLRIVCICGDAAVRIISGETGEVLTTALVPDLTSISDAVYSAWDDLLFLLLVNGKILKSSTLTNPCALLEVWESQASRSPCSCLCLYEYIVEDLLAEFSWKNLVDAATTQQQANSMYSDSKDRTLLLGGCVNGYIVVFDWQNKKLPGKITFQIEAHRDEVINMTSNPKIDQVVSSGLDNIIKVWRLFPFAEEALAPLMTLYFDELPRHLCVSHHRLLVALYERSRANYAVTVYKTTHKERFDHPSEDDHSDEVISVSSCPKMRLFATASLDGSVRIWDESSRLRQIIKLNASPSALCFCSERGDLIVAIGDSLHKITYDTYMPQSYVYRMVAMDFKDFVNDSVIPLDEDLMSNLSSVDKQRLTKPRSFFKLTDMADAVPEEESLEKQHEAKRRVEALEKIQERESDLQKLRDGELRSTRKKPKMDEHLRNEAFEKYLSLFHKRTSVNITSDSDDESMPDAYQEKDVYVPNRQPTGFFSIDPQSPLRPRDKILDDEKHLGTIATDEWRVGTDIPSRLRSQSLPVLNESDEDIQLEYKDSPAVLDDTSIELPCDRTVAQSADEKVETRREQKLSKAKKYKQRLQNGIVVGMWPGEYSSPTKPLQEISRDSANLAVSEDETGDQYESLVIAPDGYIPNSVVAALFADMRPQEEACKEEPQEDRSWKLPELTEAQLRELEQVHKEVVVPVESFSQKSSEDSLTLKVNNIKYEEQLRFALRDTPSPEARHDDNPEGSTVQKKPVTEEARPVPKPNLPKRESLLAKKVEKIKTVKPETPPEVIEEPNPECPVQPRKPSPVVEAAPPTPPAAVDPTPLPQFIMQFKGMHWFDKLFPNANPLTFPKPWTASAFVELLLIFLSKTTDYEMKQHISAAIILIFSQEGFDNHCLNKVLNGVLSELNTPIGMPTTWNPEKKLFVKTALQLLRILKKYTADVVSEFMTHFILGDEEIRFLLVEIFFDIGIKEAKRYFLRELDDFDTWGVAENAVKAHVLQQCLAWLDKWLTQFKEHIRSLAGKINRARSGHVIRGTKSPKTPSQVKGILKNNQTKNNRQMSVSWNVNTMSNAAAENVSCVDAINYFSEMQLQSELEKARARRHSLKRTPTDDNKARNTVLILPSINTKPSLVRLGETHCSHCHPERETALSLGVFLPSPVNQNKKSLLVQSLALRLNTLTLNPFPEESDAEIYECYKRHDLLTLRTSQKYFIPSRSYVHTDNVK